MTRIPNYKDVFDSTSNGVIVVNPSGEITLVNGRAEKILNRESHCPMSLLGCSVHEILPSLGQAILKCLRSGREQLGQQVLEVHPQLVVNITGISEKGQLLGAVCNFQELKQFETSARELQSYRRLNQQLEAIFNSSSDGIWVCDGTGVIIKINETSERLNGIRASEVIGQPVSVMEERGLVDQNVTPEVIRSKRQVSAIQFLKRTGKHILVTATPVLGPKEELTLVVVNERDMTHLNEIKEKLEESFRINEKVKDELLEMSLSETKQAEFVAISEKTQQLLKTAVKLSRMEVSNILLLGESGTGKGLLAEFMHTIHSNADRQFIKINCPALPENLLEAELFGYEPGAFTGAQSKGKAGLIELAEGGTLFLDEIGDLPLSVQAKLLNYLEDRQVIRLGGVKFRKVKCTIIAATNRDLEAMVRQEQFRKDLFFRLNLFTLRIPPLRERPDEIFELVRYYLQLYNAQYAVNKKIQGEALDMLQGYSFPGNVRELKSIIQKAVVLCEEEILDTYIMTSLQRRTKGEISNSPARSGKQPVLKEALHCLERDLLLQSMQGVSSTAGLARKLGISQPTAHRKLRKHCLKLHL